MSRIEAVRGAPLPRRSWWRSYPEPDWRTGTEYLPRLWECCACKKPETWRWDYGHGGDHLGRAWVAEIVPWRWDKRICWDCGEAKEKARAAGADMQRTLAASIAGGLMAGDPLADQTEVARQAWALAHQLLRWDPHRKWGRPWDPYDPGP